MSQIVKSRRVKELRAKGEESHAAGDHALARGSFDDVNGNQLRWIWLKVW